MINKILYISTNEVWSGSEELWFGSALQFQSQGKNVSYATKYSYSKLGQLRGANFRFGQKRPSVAKRILNRVFSFKSPNTPLEIFIKKIGPELIVISQGNNVGSLDLMTFCLTENIKYVTVTQLVTEAHFVQINQTNLSAFQSAYSNAAKNFFVSKHNLELNNSMFGCVFKNSTVTNNPCRFYTDQLVAYPAVKNSYNIGLVGRVECFHKGYDLLLKVLNNPKWKERNIHFNIYGNGPHIEVLKANIAEYKLTNVSLMGFINDVKLIWETNHLLCMPSRMEGQALSLIEAMYYQRAAIVTDVGGAKELITNEVNGFVAASATLHDLDEALEKAWKNRDNWEQMGKLSHNVIMKKYKLTAEESLNLELLNFLAD